MSSTTHNAPALSSTSRQSPAMSSPSRDSPAMSSNSRESPAMSSNSRDSPATSSNSRDSPSKASRDDQTPSRDGASATDSTEHKSQARPADGHTSGDDAKSPWYKRAWTKTGLSVQRLKLMFKGALAPTIAIALYQLDGFSASFPTLGYLVGILTILSQTFAPRSKFLQSMLYNLVGVAFGTCVALLTCFCAIQARIDTEVDGTSTKLGTSGTVHALEYSSSASAVAGIFLFVNVSFANAVRFMRPQLNTPIIMYSIFAMISGTYAATFSSMTQAYAFVKQLSTAFLAAFAIAMVVNVVVFPYSARQMLFADTRDFLAAFRNTMAKQQAFFQSMRDNRASKRVSDETTDPHKWALGEEAQELTSAMNTLSSVNTKFQGDLSFAKLEIAFGHLDAAEIKKMHLLIRRIFIPFMGLASTVDIYERLMNVGEVSRFTAIDADLDATADVDRRRAANGWDEGQSKAWSELAGTLCHPFQELATAMDSGLLHVSHALRLTKPPKATEKENDAEKGEASPESQQQNSRPQLRKAISDFQETRKGALHLWCKQKGFPFPDDNHESQEDSLKASQKLSRRARQQLFLILYMEQLMATAAWSVLNLVDFADGLVSSGVMSRRRMIVLGRSKIWKWARQSWDDVSGVQDEVHDASEGHVYKMRNRDGFSARKDPEHLPPANAWEKFTDKLRVAQQFLATPELAFGFRVGCATMSVAVVAYLEVSQAFFFQQRGVWALIMVAIGMTMSSGSAAFNLGGRVVGTIFAAALALANWYIAGGGPGYPGAVIPVYFVIIFCCHYILIAYPRYLIIGLIGMVTQTLIIGYELEAEKIGVVAITSNGQSYYPVYLLAPYRLAAVAAGCFVAFVWMYIPYPITARSQLRQQVGKTLFLLSNYYSIVHALSRARLSGQAGDPEDKTSPEARLMKATLRLVGRIIASLSIVRQHASYVKLEIPLGGQFPKEAYDSLTDEMSKMLRYMSILATSTQMYTQKMQSEIDSQWLHDLNKVVADTESTSQTISTILSLCSLSMSNALPLPPYLRAPTVYQLNEMLHAVDPHILSVAHFLEPGYAGFAVSQITSKLISYDLSHVLALVRSLVGEVEFSCDIVPLQPFDPKSKSTSASSSAATQGAAAGAPSAATPKGQKED